MASSAGKTFGVGVIGFGHMHINDIMRRFNEVPGFKWVAGADTTPDVLETNPGTFTRAWNLKFGLEKIGIPKSYVDYHEMLEKEHFDLILCYSENAKHAEVVEAVTAKGINIVVEKPMADSEANALRMVRAARNAGVMLAINWPSTWSSQTRIVKELIDKGVIGQPYQMKWRGGHTGPLGAGASHQGIDSSGPGLTDSDRGRSWWHRAGTGGGAMLDYCGYGACLSRWYFGEPAVAAFAMAANLGSPYAAANDNAVLSVRYPKSMAVLEASWTTLDHGVPSGPIVYGEKGTIVAEMKNGKPVIKVCHGHGVAPEYVECPALVEGEASLAQNVYRHLATGQALHPTLDPVFNLDAMAIVDAGIRSVASGKLETVNNATWCVG